MSTPWRPADIRSPEPARDNTVLGRSAEYTLRPDGSDVAVCITEELMDELLGPPFIGSPERQQWGPTSGSSRSARPTGPARPQTLKQGSYRRFDHGRFPGSLDGYIYHQFGCSA